MTTTVYMAHGDTRRSIIDILIKPIASKISGRPVYYMNGPGKLIAVSGPHEEFFNSALGICIGALFQIDGSNQSVCKKYGGTYN